MQPGTTTPQIPAPSSRGLHAGREFDVQVGTAKVAFRVERFWGESAVLRIITRPAGFRWDLNSIPRGRILTVDDQEWEIERATNKTLKVRRL